METKKCQDCKKEKPLEEFFDKRKGKDSKCKECRLAYNRERYAKTIALHTKRYTYTDVEVKVCKRCGIEKPVSEFNRHHAKTSGASKYRGECKVCQRLWRQENKEKFKEPSRLYRIKNAEKIKERKREYLSNPENLEKSRKYAREYHRNNPERQHERLCKKYGITAQQYDEMLENQNYGCAICGIKKNGRRINFVIDHDHATGKVRGLLCYQCNVGLGHFKDNPILLRKAADYLETFQP